MDEHQELNKRLAQAGITSDPPKAKPAYDEDFGDFDEGDFAKSYKQWTSHDGKVFIPASSTKKALTPGVYEIHSNSSVGTFFEKIPIKTEGLIRFPEANSNKVIAEIQKFWESEAIFRKYSLPYKRGIILWGDPGGGKSSTIQLIIADVVRRSGVVVIFDDPYLFIDGMRALRAIQPETPVVVIMEDIDAIIEHHDESEVLNLLDGVQEVDRMVFLATTNYPEKLGPRIINRPSRFDKRFKIDYPTAKSRKIYFEHLIGNGNRKAGRECIKTMGIDIKKWVADTEKMSLAHMKELFVATVILGDAYEDAVKTLKTMQEEIDEKDYDGFGFKTRDESTDADEVNWEEDED
jgi:hypothetical protein